MLEEISCQRLKATSASRRTQSEQNGEKTQNPKQRLDQHLLGKKNPKQRLDQHLLGKKSQAGLDQHLLGKKIPSRAGSATAWDFVFLAILAGRELAACPGHYKPLATGVSNLDLTFNNPW